MNHKGRGEEFSETQQLKELTLSPFKQQKNPSSSTHGKGLEISETDLRRARACLGFLQSFHKQKPSIFSLFAWSHLV